MAHLLRAYNAALLRRPMLVQCLTAGVMFGAGDVIAQQAVEKKGWKQHDVRCPLRFGSRFVASLWAAPFFPSFLVLLLPWFLLPFNALDGGAWFLGAYVQVHFALSPIPVLPQPRVLDAYSSYFSPYYPSSATPPLPALRFQHLPLIFVHLPSPPPLLQLLRFEYPRPPLFLYLLFPFFSSLSSPSSVLPFILANNPN
jgi:hypothetical protein